MTNAEIVVDDIDVTTDINSDAGRYAYAWTCPRCKEKVVYAPSGWWTPSCKCGGWSMTIEARLNRGSPP